MYCAFWKDRVRFSKVKNVNPKYIAKRICGKKTLLKDVKNCTTREKNNLTS